MTERGLVLALSLIALAIIFCMLVIIIAPDGSDTATKVVNDKEITIHFVSFNIECDTDKGIGLAYADHGLGDSRYGYAGMLSPAKYAEFCE